MNDVQRSDQNRVPCPPEVIRLVENFHNHIKTSRSNQYNDTELRQKVAAGADSIRLGAVLL